MSTNTFQLQFTRYARLVTNRNGSRSPDGTEPHRARNAPPAPSHSATGGTIPGDVVSVTGDVVSVTSTSFSSPLLDDESSRNAHHTKGPQTLTAISLKPFSFVSNASVPARRGTFTKAPVKSYVHPWYGHVKHSSRSTPPSHAIVSNEASPSPGESFPVTPNDPVVPPPVVRLALFFSSAPFLKRFLKRPANKPKEAFPVFAFDSVGGTLAFGSGATSMALCLHTFQNARSLSSVPRTTTMLAPAEPPTVAVK